MLVDAGEFHLEFDAAPGFVMRRARIRKRDVIQGLRLAAGGHECVDQRELRSPSAVLDVQPSAMLGFCSMDMLEYISDSDRRAKLAADTSSSPDYLWQIATGRRRASPALAQSIAANSPITKESLRPDIWGSEKKAA